MTVKRGEYGIKIRWAQLGYPNISSWPESNSGNAEYEAGWRRVLTELGKGEMRKRISIDQLRPGMFITGVDQSWFKTPLWLHRQLIQSDGEVQLLKTSGVQTIFIDTELGRDVDGDLSGSETDGEPSLGYESQGEFSVGHEPGFEIHEQSWSCSHTGKPLPALSFQEDLAKAHEVREEAICAVERIFDGIKTGAPLEVTSLKDLTASLLHSVIEHESPMLTEIQLQRMRHFDHSLFSHAVDVCVLSVIVGLEAQLPWDELQDLAVGALLHDVGQLRLPRNLLLKSGIFSAQERKLFEAHPQLGAKILWDAQGISQKVQRIVAEHHERVDGTGYPWGRRGSQIGSLSQLVGLVDRYDALISTRGRRPPTPPALAVRRIYQLGINGEFPMNWVERLIRCISIYPIGSLVELNTGERGWVVSVNQEDRMRPTIKLLWDRKRKRMAEPVTVELSAFMDHDPTRKIQRVLNPIVEGVSEELF